MTEINYARAQARWLAVNFPQYRIHPDDVERVEAQYEPGYSYSSYTYEDARWELVVHHRTHPNVLIDLGQLVDGGERKLDLTRMVVEGLELELAAASEQL